MLDITPFESAIAEADARAVEAEGLRLLELLAPGERHDVRFGAVRP